MSNSYPAGIQEILDEFSSFEDPEMKSELLIEFSDRFTEVPEEIAKRPYPKERLVPGCESEAYLWGEPLDDGGMRFYFAIENPHGISAKSFAVILQEGLRGASIDDIASLNEELVYEIFGRTISMGRSQGLMGMVRMLRYLAKHPDANNVCA